MFACGKGCETGKFSATPLYQLGIRLPVKAPRERRVPNRVGFFRGRRRNECSMVELDIVGGEES